MVELIHVLTMVAVNRCLLASRKRTWAGTLPRHTYRPTACVRCCSLSPMDTSPLNPSLPGVRLLQHWIREQRPLSIDVIGHERWEGRLIWQDPEFLALEVNNSSEQTLINHSQVSINRPLG